MKIPESVLQLLTRKWTYRNACLVDFSSEGSLHHHETYTSRFTRKRRARHEGYSFKDIRALIDDDVLVPLADNGDTVDIDLQEQIALTYFFAEIYFAWYRYRTRVAHYRQRRADAAKHREKFAEQDRLERERIDAKFSKMTRNSSHFMRARK